MKLNFFVAKFCRIWTTKTQNFLNFLVRKLLNFTRAKTLLQFVCNSCNSELYACMQPTCHLQRDFTKHLELLHITPWLYENILLKVLLILRERVLAYYLYCLLTCKVKPEGKGTMGIRTLPLRQLYSAGQILVMSLSEILYCASEALWTLWHCPNFCVFNWTCLWTSSIFTCHRLCSSGSSGLCTSCFRTFFYFSRLKW